MTKPKSRRGPPSGIKQRRARPSQQYHIVVISLYDEDLEALDAKVTEAKTFHTRASRSDFIREALNAFTVADYGRAIR